MAEGTGIHEVFVYSAEREHSLAQLDDTFTGFVLSRVTNIEDPNRSHEIELWPADVDISVVLYKITGEAI